MQPIQINVSVNIGVNQELYGLLSSLFNRPQAEVAPTPAPRKSRATKQQAEVSESKPAPEPQPEAAPAEAAPVQAQEAKEYTEVDIRAAMDRTRKRIEGENYKEQTDSEGYKQWHRTLTAWFKNTATMCGAERPSALPDSESRAKFIACCDAVHVKDNELVEDCPF